MPSTGHTSIRMTSQELLRLPEDLYRHELIDGVHYVTPAPTLRHQRILRRLTGALLLWLHDHPVGEMFFAPADVILSELDLVIPDLIYVSNERSAILQDQVNGAPDLVVEILSPSTQKRDEHTKRHLYDRAGVREYWIIDPRLDSITIYRRAADGFPCVAQLSSARGDILTTPLLPDFSLELEHVFRDPAART